MFATASDFRTSLTSAGEANGLAWRYSAASPATCGVAIDVPEMTLVADGLPIHADLMLTPGANRSTQEPQFENHARTSLLPVNVVAATVSAVGADEGEKLHALALSFPAATA